MSTIMFMLAFYLADPDMMLNPGVFWGRYLIVIAVMWLAADNTDLNKPPSPIRRRVRAAFVVVVIANLLFYIFYHILFAYVDPSLVTLQYELAMEAGLPDISEGGFEPTFGKTLFSFGSSLIGGFILSYIIAYIQERIN